MRQALATPQASPGLPLAADPDFLANRVDRYFREEERRSVVCGRSMTADAIQLRSNDYLSLANHPNVMAAQAEALVDHGNGILMSGVFLDDHDSQRSLEHKFASLIDSEDCAISQSGYNANVGLIQAIADKDVPVYIDMRAHASLWEGANSAGAPAHAFRHNDVEHLEKQILTHGAGVVVVDSVYSTVGTVCPLIEVVDLANRLGCVLIVDESHSLGTHGTNGEGLVAALGLQDRVHFRTASLAKAFAGRGGLVAGSARNIEYFRYKALPAIFSSVLLPHEIAGFEATLTVIRQEAWRRTKLHRNAEYLREGLTMLGYHLGDATSQIIPLEAGPEARTVVLRDALEARGVFGAVFCAPATPKNRSMVRLTVNCALSRDDLDHVLSVCEDIRDLVEADKWPNARKSARTSRSRELEAA
ncbi:MAG: hypothetical protein CMM50_15950 [Rhodospirillaceae bacterium]|nr:hypothetical protein [Rhodospirillaceae bacterium]